MESDLRSTLDKLVSNFNLSNELDYHSYEHAVKGLNTQEQIDALNTMAEVIEAPQADTYEELKEKYREIFRQSIAAAVKIAEFKAVLLAIDFKFSLFVSSFEEIVSEYEDSATEPLSDYFSRISVTPNHHIFHFPEDEEEYRWRKT